MASESNTPAPRQTSAEAHAKALRVRALSEGAWLSLRLNQEIVIDGVQGLDAAACDTPVGRVYALSLANNNAICCEFVGHPAGPGVGRSARGEAGGE